jgi:hypothetical protein
MARKRASALICHERKRGRHKTATIFIGGSTAAARRRATAAEGAAAAGLGGWG